MAGDIASELLATIRADYEKRAAADPAYQSLLRKISAGKATQADAARVAERLGQILSDTLLANLTPQTLPDGVLYHNIAEKTITPMLQTVHAQVNAAAIDTQRVIDRANGLGIESATGDFPTQRISDMLYTACKPESDPLTRVEKLFAPVVNNCQAFHDQYVKKNADIRYKAGMRPQIVRIAAAGCCKWCSALAGAHDYEKVKNTGNDVFRRHENCGCSVDYVTDGKRQDVWSKRLWQADADTLAERKTQGAAAETPTPQERIARYEDAKVVDNGGERGIINTKVSNGRVVNPMQEEQYRRMCVNLEAQGVRILQAKGDDLRYLYSLGAEATYGHGYIMHIGEIPSASALFEEIIHSTQAKIYGEFTGSEPVELYAREIAANRMLLQHHKAYGFDATDVVDIRQNLGMWESKFLQATGVTYDEGSIKREI